MKSILGTLLLRHSKRCASSSSAAVEYAKVALDDGIKTITMCHAKTRNSLSIGMMEHLIGHLNSDWDNRDLRVVVIQADGPIFSAGHNLKELSSQSGKESHNKVFALANTLMMSIVNNPVPIVAKVDGLAAAAGCQLVAQCDLAVCTEESQFMTPGVNFGIFCSTPGVALSRAVDKSTALKMLLTGKPITSEEALRCGLVALKCPKNLLDSQVHTVCEDIKSKSRSVVELGKKFYYKQVQMSDISAAYTAAGQTMVANLETTDGIEGINSFVEKRKPNWSHK